MPDSGAFHWPLPLHLARSQYRCSVPHTQVIADFAGIMSVFVIIDGGPAPANHHIRYFTGSNGTGVTQNGKDQIYGMVGAGQIETDFS